MNDFGLLYIGCLCEDVDDLVNFVEKTKNEHPELHSLHIYNYGDDKIKLDTIAVKPEFRKRGIGSVVIKKIQNYANEKKKSVILTAGVRDPHFGTTSQSRLDKFYRGHGFVANKGRNKDYSIMATHVYTPPSLNN
jgi:predicted GNAT family acetyltransferase